MRIQAKNLNLDVKKQSYPLHWRVPLSTGEQPVFKYYLIDSTLNHVFMVN